MEEELLIDVWGPLLQSGGRALTATVLVAAAYKKLKGAVVGRFIEPYQNNASTQLPQAFERAQAHINQLIAQTLPAILMRHMPYSDSREQLHDRSLCREMKLRLWDEVAVHTLVGFVAAPLVQGIVCNAVMLRAALTVLCHYNSVNGGNEGGDDSNAAASAAASSPMDSMLERLMKQMGGSSPFDDSSFESFIHDTLVPLLDQRIVPFICHETHTAIVRCFRHAATDSDDEKNNNDDDKSKESFGDISASQDFFANKLFSMTERVSCEDFLRRLSKARSLVEGEIDWENLFLADIREIVDVQVSSSIDSPFINNKMGRKKARSNRAIASVTSDDVMSFPSAQVSSSGFAVLSSLSAAVFPPRCEADELFIDVASSTSFSSLILAQSDELFATRVRPEFFAAFEACKSFERDGTNGTTKHWALMLQVAAGLNGKSRSLVYDNLVQVSQLGKDFATQLVEVNEQAAK